MTRYIRGDNGWISAETGLPMIDKSVPWVPTMPMIMRDIDPYQSPASGKWIGSRSEARDDLASTGCRIMEAGESPTGGKLRNQRFADKHGLTVSDEYRDYDSSKPKDTAA